MKCKIVVSLGFALLARLAFADTTAQVEPPDPTSAEPVTLIVKEFDSCPPDPEVTRSGFTITVALGFGICLAPPIEITHRIELGILPPGRYELIVTDGGEPSVSTSFVVFDASDEIRIAPSLGRIGGGTVVNIVAEVGHCAGADVRSCPPPIITFDSVSATDVVAIDNSHFRATVPPHAAGAVEVRVVSSSAAKSSYVFRYYDPAAAPLPIAFERILIPVFFNGPGAHGSKWATEVTLRNANPYGVEPWRAIDGRSDIPPYTPQIVRFPSAPGGVFLIVPRESALALHFNALVRDVSREATAWGAEIPVVRERDFSITPIELLNVPLDARFRHTLRIYQLGSALAFVRLTIYSMNDARVLLERLLPLTSAEPCAAGVPCATDQPASVVVGDFAAAFPELPSSGRIGIHVQRWTSGPIWAFVTITNNETQHVTVVSPQ